MNHLNYLKYVLRHKWYVFLACLKFKVSIWQAITHDWSKFTPAEWWPYVNTFYAPDGSKRYNENPAFAVAWNHHQKINPHHWQYWLITWDRGNTEPIPMPEKYIREMVADWAGAGKAITGKWEYAQWYAKNKENIKLHSETRKRVEELLTPESTGSTRGNDANK